MFRKIAISLKLTVRKIENPGRNTPLVFIHGLAADKAQAAGIMERVKGIKLITMDCPGHRATPLDQSSAPSFDAFADHLVHTVKSGGTSKAIFGGISMGAALSINIAIRYPEMVSGLVLIRPAWLDRKCPDNLALLLEAAPLLDVVDGMDKFKRSHAFGQLASAPEGVRESVLGVFNTSQRPELKKVLQGMVCDRPFKSLTDLQSIQCPSVVIGNDNDPLHPFPIAEQIHRHLPGSSLSKVISRYVDDDAHKEAITNLTSNFSQSL